MNYLAHIYLARHSEEAMVGALLGDFVKPSADGQFSAAIAAEIMRHRRIDSFTDSHRHVLAAKQLFVGPSRRYAGILLDVFYDHLLARAWLSYCDEPLDAFVARFYDALRRHAAILPPQLAGAMERMIEQDWLGSYRQYEGVEVAIRRTSQRLSKNGDLLRAGLVDLKANYDALGAGFDLFFPELIDFVAAQRAAR
ncbi:MAG: ACP phosphodiesterase [Pseudomonadota bacterium]